MRTDFKLSSDFYTHTMSTLLTHIIHMSTYSTHTQRERENKLKMFYIVKKYKNTKQKYQIIGTAKRRAAL